MDTISNVLINIISSFFYDEINIWTEKKRIQKFKEEIAAWITEFEQKNDGTKNDGTIVTKDIFSKYIENYKIIQKMMRYVLYAAEKEEGEDSFIKNIQNNFEQYAMSGNVQIIVTDRSVLKEFFGTIFDKIKRLIYSEIDISDQAILYCLMQNRLDIQDAAKRFSITEETLKRIENEILTIRIALSARSYSDDWFIKQNNEQIKNLGNRYLPELNISTNTSRIFDGLAKNNEFYGRLRKKQMLF